MEGLAFAAQEQVLATDAIKVHIYSITFTVELYRLCGSSDKSVYHLVSCCSALAQKEYKNQCCFSCSLDVSKASWIPCARPLVETFSPTSL